MKKIKFLLITCLFCLILGFSNISLSADESTKYDRFKERTATYFNYYNSVCLDLVVSGENVQVLVSNGKYISRENKIYGLLYIVDCPNDVHLRLKTLDSDVLYNGSSQGWISGFLVDENSTIEFINDNKEVITVSLWVQEEYIEGAASGLEEALPPISFAKGNLSLNRYYLLRNILTIILFIVLLSIVIIPIKIIKNKNKRTAISKYNNVIDSTESTAEDEERRSYYE